MFEKIASITAVIGALVAGVWGLEERYAIAEDIETQMKQKADYVTVNSILREMMKDKKLELEMQCFKLENKSSRSEIEEFELRSLQSRIKELENELSSKDSP